MKHRTCAWIEYYVKPCENKVAARSRSIYCKDHTKKWKWVRAWFPGSEEHQEAKKVLGILGRKKR